MAGASLALQICMKVQMEGKRGRLPLVIDRLMLHEPRSWRVSVPKKVCFAHRIDGPYVCVLRCIQFTGALAGLPPRKSESWTGLPLCFER